MGRDYKAYLLHILDSIVLIEDYTSSLSFGEFERDRKTIDAVIRNFEIIGEASSKLPKNLGRSILRCRGRALSACEMF